MKKKLLALSTILALTLGAAQAQKKISFGARLGTNFTNVTGKNYNGDKLDNKMKVGFHLGVNAEVNLADEFYLQPGLLFSTKGSKSEENDVKSSVNLTYVEIPVNFIYKPTLGAGKLLLGAGPYLGIAVAGKAKSGDNSTTIKFKNKVEAGDAGASLKRMDAGANLLAGYELTSKISFQLNAQLGLTNINPKMEGDSESKAKSKNTGFGISLGYRF